MLRPWPRKRQRQPSQSVYYPWSAHNTSPSGKWPSPFPRRFHALSSTPTAAGELFLFGGNTYDHTRNDLYLISTRDFSTTLLQTSGDVPSPRYGHTAVFTNTTLLIWGGRTESNDNDDSFYLLNLISREWTRIVIDGPGPGGRYYHTMTLVGSKLFVFGGRTARRGFDDIWAFDLNHLKSNPRWESCDPAPGKKKPHMRAGHVSVTTGDRIIIFGGAGLLFYDDTWSFDISTRKWTELQCTGSIPSPRAGHIAVLIDDVMYVYGGHTVGRTNLDDLTAWNLSTQRWIAFQDIGPSPSGRSGHAVASDGRRVFVLGGELSPDAQADETKLIHVLDTKCLDYPEPDSDSLNAQLVRKSSMGPPTREQPSSSWSGAHFQNATPEERVPEEDDERLIELERQLSETLVAKTERDQRIAQLTDKLSLKSALLEQAEANAAEEKRRVGLELHGLQAKLDESLLSRDQALEQCHLAEANAAEERDRARLELLELQAQLDESLLYRDDALEQAKADAAGERVRAGLELRELQAKLDDLLLSRDHALEQAKADAAEERERAGQELRELQAKLDKFLSRDQALEQAEANAAEKKERAGLELDESLLYCDHALEQALSALQKVSYAAEVNQQNQRELMEIRAELEAKMSESARALRLRLAVMESGCAQSKAESDTHRTQTGTGLVNTDELLERVQALEADMISLQCAVERERL